MPAKQWAAGGVGGEGGLDCALDTLRICCRCWETSRLHVASIGSTGRKCVSSTPLTVWTVVGIRHEMRRGSNLSVSLQDCVAGLCLWES